MNVFTQCHFELLGNKSPLVHVCCLSLGYQLCVLLLSLSSPCSSGQLAAIPQFARLGPLFKSSEKPVELTETETEYVVRCVKHVFPKHVVFQVRSGNVLGVR